MNEKDLIEKTAVVTGATSGLGFEAAKALALRGASVVIASRNEQLGEKRLKELRRLVNSPIRFELLDLADLKSVQKFASRIGEKKIDILINNAGVATVPDRHTTKDGFELQLGTNFLGHFALTAELLPKLLSNGGARIVMLSSLAHHIGRIHIEDLQLAKGYGALKAYAQSKLASLMFALSLQRLSDERGWKLTCAAAHPGFANTNMPFAGPFIGSNHTLEGLLIRLSAPLNPVFAQSAANGALPEIFAATDESVIGGSFYGPDGFAEIRGEVSLAKVARRAQDQEMQASLWAAAEKLTGARFTATGRT